MDDHLAHSPAFRDEWERTALARAVANRLARCRAEHALSQRALAQRLGVRQPMVARLELGEHKPTVETLPKLSDALGLEFLLGVGPAAQLSSAPNLLADTGACVETVESERSAVLAAAR